VGDEVDFGIRSFEEHVDAAGGVVEDMAEDAAFEVANRLDERYLHREALVGQKRGVGR
jgi:hypothetical protein